MVKYPNGGVPSQTYIGHDGKKLRITPKRKRKRQPEHDIQNGIIEMLSMHHCKVWRINVGSVEMKNGHRFSAGPKPGFPDLCGYRQADGKMFFIEVKTQTGRRRQSQDNFAADIAYDPVIYGVARSPEEALMIVQKGLNRTEDVK